VTTSYKKGREVEEIDNYPTNPIEGAIKRIKKKYSPELLESVHIEDAPADGEA